MRVCCATAALVMVASILSAGPVRAEAGDLLVEVLRHVVVGGQQQRGASSGTLRLASERWLVIASRPTPSEAAAVAEAHGQLLGGAAVVGSSNGHYAVIGGTLLIDKAKANLDALKALRLIPQDSFLSDGRNFFDVVWNGIGDSSSLDVMTRPAYQRSVRRIQAALLKLGLYDSAIDGLVGPTTTDAFKRYTARYATPLDVMTDDALVSMEETAIDGFADDATRGLALARGFTDAESYTEASSGGFYDASEYMAARAVGFRSSADFAAASAGGFRDAAHYQQAQAAGFRTAGAMELAERAGFTQAEGYERFRQSGFRDAETFRRAAREGFEDRASFERANAERLDAARATGREVLSDADAFLRLNPDTPDLLAIAAEVATLNGAMAGDNAASVAASIARLDTILLQIPNFASFRQARAAERTTQEQRLARDLKAELETYRVRLTRWTAANLTSELLPPIVAELKLLEQDVGTRDVAVLQAARDRVASVVEREGLGDEIDILQQSDAADVVDEATERPAIAAVTERNRMLLEGDREAVVVLYNAATSAPSLVRNLVGDFVFTGKANAIVCVGGLEMGRAERRALTEELKRFDAGGLMLGAQDCASDDVAHADLLILQRRAFLEAAPDFAIAVLDAIEARNLLLFDAMPFETVTNRARQEAELAEAISSGVRGEQRDGYGALALAPRAGPICAETGKDREAHAAMLAALEFFARTEDLTLEPTVFEGVEEIFARARGERCALVYGPAASLRQIATALERDGRQVGFVPLWFDETALEEVSGQLAAVRNESEREAAARRREQEEAQARHERQRTERARTREAREMRLRDENGAKAAALSNLYADGLRTYVLGGRAAIHSGDEADAAALVAELFPQFGGWSDGLDADEWRATEVGIAIDDYGLSTWKGRSLEAIILKVETRVVSRSRGEYRTRCHLLGAVYDGEFGMHREPFEASCENGVQDLVSWKAGNGLQSLWVAAE